MELRGCWEPKPEAADVNVLSKVLDDAARVRRGRTPVPAYRPAEVRAARGFVPVESLAERPGETTSDPETVSAQGAGVSTPTAGPEVFVIEPETGWAERTSLFGDPEG